MSVRFSPSSLQLLAMSLDSAVRLWDLANARVLKTYTGHLNTKYAGTALFAYLPSAALPQTLVVAPSESREIYLWDLQTKRVIQKLAGHRDAVAAIAVRVLADAGASHAARAGLGGPRARRVHTALGV